MGCFHSRSSEDRKKKRLLNLYVKDDKTRDQGGNRANDLSLIIGAADLNVKRNEFSMPTNQTTQQIPQPGTNARRQEYQGVPNAKYTGNQAVRNDNRGYQALSDKGMSMKTAISRRRNDMSFTTQDRQQEPRARANRPAGYVPQNRTDQGTLITGKQEAGKNYDTGNQGLNDQALSVKDTNRKRRNNLSMNVQGSQPVPQPAKQTDCRPMVTGGQNKGNKEKPVVGIGNASYQGESDKAMSVRQTTSKGHQNLLSMNTRSPQEPQPVKRANQRPQYVTIQSTTNRGAAGRDNFSTSFQGRSDQRGIPVQQAARRPQYRAPQNIGNQGNQLNQAHDPGQSDQSLSVRQGTSNKKRNEQSMDAGRKNQPENVPKTYRGQLPGYKKIGNTVTMYDDNNVHQAASDTSLATKERVGSDRRNEQSMNTRQKNQPDNNAPKKYRGQHPGYKKIGNTVTMYDDNNVQQSQSDKSMSIKERPEGRTNDSSIPIDRRGQQSDEPQERRHHHHRRHDNEPREEGTKVTVRSTASILLNWLRDCTS